MPAATPPITTIRMATQPPGLKTEDRPRDPCIAAGYTGDSSLEQPDTGVSRRWKHPRTACCRELICAPAARRAFVVHQMPRRAVTATLAQKRRSGHAASQVPGSPPHRHISCGTGLVASCLSGAPAASSRSITGRCTALRLRRPGSTARNACDTRLSTRTSVSARVFWK